MLGFGFGQYAQTSCCFYYSLYHRVVVNVCRCILMTEDKSKQIAKIVCGSNRKQFWRIILISKHVSFISRVIQVL